LLDIACQWSVEIVYFGQWELKLLFCLYHSSLSPSVYVFFVSQTSLSGLGLIKSVRKSGKDDLELLSV
jgi:hypothetical protein